MDFTVRAQQVDGEWKVQNAGQEGEDPDVPSTPSATELGAEKAEILSVVGAALDALTARDCGALRETLWETLWDANADCAELFDEMPRKLELGTVHDPTGSGLGGDVDVDIVVDGESFPQGMQIHLRNEDQGWEVFDWEYSTS